MILSEKLFTFSWFTKLLGISPFLSATTIPVWKALLLVFQFLYVCVLSFPCVFQCVETFSLSIADRKLELSELISLLEVSFLSISAMIGWFLSLVFHQHFMKMISALREIDNLFTSLQVDVSQESRKAIKLLQLVFFVSFVLIFNALEYFENGYNWGYLLVLPIALGSFYQFTHFIVHVSYRFACLNKYLCKYTNVCATISVVSSVGDISASSYCEKQNVLEGNETYTGFYSKWQKINCSIVNKRNTTRNTDFKQLQNIRITREIFSHLYDLCNEINSYFSYHILFCLMSKITSITLVLYYLLSSTNLNDLQEFSLNYLIPRINKALLCSSNFIQLIILVFLCVSTSEYASFTGVLVHGLMNSSAHKGLENDLELFSLQILHQKVTFTAAGLFALDFTLINAVIGAVTTYLVILIQFQIPT